MKAIQINIEGVVRPRFSAIAHEGVVYHLSEKAANFIKAQSVDGKVYQCGEPCDKLFCYKDGQITRYFVKKLESISTFPVKDELRWRLVELRVIDIME